VDSATLLGLPTASGTLEVLAMAEVWGEAGAAVSEEGLARISVWVVGMEEASEGGLFILRGERDTARPVVLTPRIPRTKRPCCGMRLKP